MSEIKLLPCPFCGKDAFIIKNGAGCFQVSCSNCEVRQYAYAHKTKEGAIRAWNTRKPIDNIVEQLEEKSLKCKMKSASLFCEEDYINNTVKQEIKHSNDMKALAYDIAIDIIRAGGKE